jgi:hypothetical protein
LCRGGGTFGHVIARRHLTSGGSGKECFDHIRLVK